MTQHTWALAHVNAVTPQGILKDVCVYAQNGKIVRIGADIPPDVPVTEAPGAWALPGLVDLHIHGSGGFGPEQGTPEALWQMSDVLAQQG